jgi:outer membrane protein
MRRLALVLGLLVSGAAISTPSAQADHDGPWMVRGRILDVLPDESATITPIGGDVKIDDSIVPELDITYFFDKHWAAELILATTSHDVKHTPTGLDLGTTWLLPPTLTVQYHFFPESEHFRPYLGAGVNYTMFYKTEEPAGLNVDYKNNFGLALQAGFDVPLGNGWSLNVDVKKIFLNTDVTIQPLGVHADTDINPWIVGVGLGYRW